MDGPPPPLNGVDAYDTPGDHGGNITVVWEPTGVSDFGQYELFIQTAPFNSVLGLTAEVVLSVRDVSNSLVSSHGGGPLAEGEDYWLAVVALFALMAGLVVPKWAWS